MDAIRTLSAIFLLIVFMAEANAVAIVNGSFEDTTGMTPGPPVGNFFNGVPVGWSYTGTEVQLLSSAGPGAPTGIDGDLYLEIFNQSDLGTLSQILSDLVIGQTYLVSFLWGNRGVAVPGFDDYDFTVAMGGATFARSGSGLVDMTPASIAFIATATNSTLNISFNDPGSDTVTGGALDAFAIRAVPEPTTLLLLGLGLAGLGFTRRRLH